MNFLGPYSYARRLDMIKIDQTRLKLAMDNKDWGALDTACAWWDKFDETITVQTIYNWLRGGNASKNYHRHLEKLFNKPKGYFSKKESLKKKKVSLKKPPKIKSKTKKKPVTKKFGIF
jgi:hypothetical protein